MTDQNNTAPVADANPLSDEYVNAVIERHGYDSPEAVIARLWQWIGLHGGEDSVTLLMYEAHKALVKLRGPVAEEDSQPTAPDDDAIAECWVNASDIDGIAYDGPSFERGYRAALASAPADPEAAEVDFLVRVLENLDTWRAEEWSELLGRRPAILAMLRPMVMASAPVDGEAQPMAWFRKTDITEWTDTEPETDGWTPLYDHAAPQASEAVRDAPTACDSEVMREAAWHAYRKDVGTGGWTVAEAFHYRGLFMHGWRAALSAQPGAQRTGGSDA